MISRRQLHLNLHPDTNGQSTVRAGTERISPRCSVTGTLVDWIAGVLMSQSGVQITVDFGVILFVPAQLGEQPTKETLPNKRYRSAYHHRHNVAVAQNNGPPGCPHH
jgi:hypothetical protein